MMDDNPTDPKENPEGTGHLPVAGEVGIGRVGQTDDPVTEDTDDNPDSQPTVESGDVGSNPADS